MLSKSIRSILVRSVNDQKINIAMIFFILYDMIKSNYIIKTRWNRSKLHRPIYI